MLIPTSRIAMLHRRAQVQPLRNANDGKKLIDQQINKSANAHSLNEFFSCHPVVRCIVVVMRLPYEEEYSVPPDILFFLLAILLKQETEEKDENPKNKTKQNKTKQNKHKK